MHGLSSVCVYTAKRHVLFLSAVLRSALRSYWYNLPPHVPSLTSRSNEGEKKYSETPAAFFFFYFRVQGFISRRKCRFEGDA